MEKEKLYDGEQRRAETLKILKREKQPVSGTELAKLLGVSRQVVVQDIALLRAINKNIMSTNKGYVMFEPMTTEKKCNKAVQVRHTTEEVLDEFYTIVDLGGRVLNVVVEHDIYGQIAVDLIIANRQDAEDFYKKMKQSKVKPLKELTGDVHYHTIEADTEQILDAIEKELLRKGYLVLS